MTTIVVWAEDAKLLGELCAKATALGGTAQQFDSASLPDQDQATIAAGLADAAKKASATLVLVGASKKGKDIGPRAAGHLDWPFASECSAITGGNGWTVERMVLSGNSKATYTMGQTAVCTVIAKTFEGSGQPAGKVSGSAQASKVKVVAKKEETHSDFDLASAAVVVGVGRGFKQQGDLKLAEGLAKCFPGGAVGCSRPIAADLKWLGEEHWIGLSGHQIAPKAYIAVGLSGQIQHIAGIRQSKLIVAINTNKDAPIMQVADYAIVGDLYQVLPKLTDALKNKVPA